MGTSFLKNMAGLKCTDFEMLQIPRPRLELTIHVTTKTAQAGAVVGSLLAAPLIHLVKSGSGSQGSLKQEMVNGGLYGSLAGAVIGCVGNMMYMQKFNDVQVYDRCYRIRFNKNQLTTDRLFYAGSAVGAGLGGPSGYVLGANLSLLGAYLVNSMRK